MHAAIAKPDRGAVGDAAIVDLGEETLVVDTHFSSPSGARAAGRGGRAHRPAGGVGVEHALAQRPRARQRRVRGSDRRLHDADARADRHRGVERLAAQKQWLEAELPAELERLRAAGDHEGAALLEEGAPELRAVTHRLPDETFDERWERDGAEAITFGGGHTESDAFLLVPDQPVLVAGDLVVVGMQPWAGHGDPGAWAAILERMLELDWEACIPGHGPVSGREVVPPLRHYLLALDDAVLSDEPDPKLPAAFADWDGAEMWGRNLAALRER